MDQRAHREMTDRILADLVRSSITNSLANNLRTNTNSERRPKSIMPIGDDLTAYLRSIHRLLVTREVAAILHWHTETVCRRIESSHLPAQRDGKRWKYDPTEIADWIGNRRLDRGEHFQGRQSDSDSCLIEQTNERGTPAQQRYPLGHHPDRVKLRDVNEELASIAARLDALATERHRPEDRRNSLIVPLIQTERACMSR